MTSNTAGSSDAGIKVFKLVQGIPRNAVELRLDESETEPERIQTRERILGLAAHAQHMMVSTGLSADAIVSLPVLLSSLSF